jgi:hypothetical protein
MARSAPGLPMGRFGERSPSAPLCVHGVQRSRLAPWVPIRKRTKCRDIGFRSASTVVQSLDCQDGTRGMTMCERSPRDDRAETLTVALVAPANAHAPRLCAFKTCPVCGARLPRERNAKARCERVYCSDACRAKAWRRRAGSPAQNTQNSGDASSRRAEEGRNPGQNGQNRRNRLGVVGGKVWP